MENAPPLLGFPERVELGVVVVAAGTAGALAGGAPTWIPASVSVGGLLLLVSALLLGQGLVRDLHTRWRESNGPVGAPQKLLCMCMESTLGMLGVVCGALALLGGLGGQVALGPVHWSALVLGVGTFGVLIKDLVIDLQGRTLRRVRNHGRIHLW